MCLLWTDIIGEFVGASTNDATGIVKSFASQLALMPSSNLTHFPIYDHLEIDEINQKYALRTSFPKYSNSPNHNNKHHHQHRQHHHKQHGHLHYDRNANANKCNVHHLNDADSHRHQRKLEHGSSRNEWIRYALQTDDNKPKARRRHEKRWNRQHHLNRHQQYFVSEDHIASKLHADLEIQSARMLDATNHSDNINVHWPVKKEAIMEGDVILGGLMMVHSRSDSMMCGPIMPQGGIQALEAMLYTLDKINEDSVLLPNITIGAHVLDDCDRDSYGLEMAVDFIKGTSIPKIKTITL